jgi:hypothetical protein
MKTLPTRVKSLDHNYIFTRIYELLDMSELHQNYYNSIYLCFFSQVGFPIGNSYQKSEIKSHDELSYSDVIILDEILNYSRLYQHVSRDINQYECLIIEQYLDRNTNPEVPDVWKHNIPSNLEYKHMDVSEMPILDLDTLKTNDLFLYDEFTKFIKKHANEYVKYVFQQLKNKYPAKYETITMQCDNIERLQELLLEAYLKKLFN